MADEPARRLPHPRRPPAHKSVSLRHSAALGPQLPSSRASVQRRNSRVSSSNQANPPSSSDSKEGSTSVDERPAPAKDSSGGSSNAEKWFEKSNNRVKANANHGADSEPPFFLQNSSSSETPPGVAHNRQALAAHSPAPARPHELTRMETQGSGSEDFRSVIDDLTVENKKLKRKLKKYEKLYDAHLQQDKLFEIRMHGLRGAKKRELEETLRKFAMSLGDSSPKLSAPTESTSGYETSAPALEPNATSSSHTSTKFADSAYVSNTNSGPNSTPSTRERTNRNSGKTALSRRQDIQSYLHDIPASLLPRQPVAMTEKAKRRLVVRRLEQIFAGKGAAVSGHQQPLQQQEVSQSAAHADRMAIEASGRQARAEGIREARIMPKSEETTTMDIDKPDVVSNLPLQKTTSAGDTTGKDSPDQRPTRPLDLDLHRAQVPQDNIEYIRHLGFSPADPDVSTDQDGHGWVYLNVLINMAQLHTLNVTTDFVKKSIGEHSKKFQISRDGRKVRWKGGHDVTRSSSNSSPGDRTETPNSRAYESAAKLKPSLGQLSSEASEESLVKASAKGSGHNKLAYVPLFFHKQASEGDETTSDEHVTSWGSPQQDQLRGNSSGFTSTGPRTNSSKRKHGEDGPIIFYNGAKFCTDLSGDRNENLAPQQSNVKYNPVATNPVGSDCPKPSDDDEDERRRPLTMAPPSEDAMDIDDVDESDEDMEGGLKFSPKAPSATHTISSPPNINFEVSGLGGVQPTDNFRIEVQSKRRARPHGAASNATRSTRNKVYPPKIMEILRSGRPEGHPQESSGIEEEVVSTREERLPASALPPPASLFAFDSVETDDEDAMDGSGAESDVSSLFDEHVPSTVPQMLHFSSSSTNAEESDDDEMDDGSVDFLAHARLIDPMAVHEREREYDANMAEKLAEDIPAGSSAATAGGGSGFNSPASLERVGSAGRSRSGSAMIMPSLKRALPSNDSAAHSAGGKQPKLD